MPPEQQGKIIIGQAIVEIYTGRYEEAQDILNAAKPLFETASHALKGRWHGHMGLVLRRLAQGRTEILDKALLNTQPQSIITNRQGMNDIAEAT